MSVSVKRKPIYCGSCSMDLTNAVRIRCAQLGPPLPPASLTTATMASGGAEAQLSTSASAAADSSPTKATNGVAVEGKAAEAHMNGSTTKKHDSIDALPTGPRSDGLVPTCEDFDICGTCFCEGKEVGRHKRWHDYRVIVRRRLRKEAQGPIAFRGYSECLMDPSTIAIADPACVSHLH